MEHNDWSRWGPLGRLQRSWRICICLVAAAGLGTQRGAAAESGSAPGDLRPFLDAAGRSPDKEALVLGDKIFAELRHKYRLDGNFGAYEARLKAAEFLAGRMRQEMQKAAGAQLTAMVDEVLGDSAAAANPGGLVIAPAKHFYETSMKVFSAPVSAEKLTAEEKSFLLLYYDLKLRTLTGEIAQAGQALAVAQPGFGGTYEYTLVLPLLHASESRPVNTALLPLWMQQPDQLSILADSCLLHFGLPVQAMAIARKAAAGQDKEFAEREYYRGAADRCGAAYPHMAADCLQRALGAGTDPNTEVDLRFRIVQLWMDSKNYVLAASEARKIFDNHPDHSEVGKAVWLHYHALANSNDFHTTLNSIDEAIKNPRCEPFRARLLYLKWMALRRKGGQTAQVALVEHELLEKHGHEPLAANVLLSRAVDLLAAQAYAEAHGLLVQLVEKFPGTQAAEQGRRMMQRLPGTKRGP